LIIATIPTFFFKWDMESDETWSTIPALCFLDQSKRSSMKNEQPFNLITSRNFVSALASLLYLVISYVTRIVKLFKPVSLFIRKTAVAPIGHLARATIAFVLRWLDEATRRKLGARVWFLWVETPVVAAYSLARLLLLIYASAFSDLIGIYFGCLLGLSKLQTLRDREQSLTGREPGDSNKLKGFGQLLPVLLLVTPIITIGQGFACQESDGNDSPVITEVYPRDETPKGHLYSLTSTKRWTRLECLLTQNLPAFPWFFPAAFGVLIGEFSALVTLYHLMAWDPKTFHSIRGSSMFLLWGHTELAYVLPMALASVLVGIATAGWTPRAAKWIAWVCNIMIAAYYLLLHILEFAPSDIYQTPLFPVRMFGVEELEAILPLT
jgi:hypothetical protein